MLQVLHLGFKSRTWLPTTHINKPIGLHCLLADINTTWTPLIYLAKAFLTFSLSTSTHVRVTHSSNILIFSLLTYLLITAARLYESRVGMTSGQVSTVYIKTSFWQQACMGGGKKKLSLRKYRNTRNSWPTLNVAGRIREVHHRFSVSVQWRTEQGGGGG